MIAAVENVRPLPIVLVLKTEWGYNFGKRASVAYFPLFANLDNKEILVVGGGDISYQQISTFLIFGAKIYLLANDITPHMKVLADAYSQKVTVVQKEPSVAAIQELNCNPTLVVAATNNASLNAEIYSFYENKNVLVENISKRAKCDFIFPAILKRGDVVCGISSSGKSPLVSHFIKRLLESSLPDSISEINDHMDEINRAVKQSVSDPSKRSQVLQAIFARLLEDDNQTPDYEIDGIIGEAEL